MASRRLTVRYFATPLVAFALQTPMVRNFEYGSAFSALGAAILYISLALVLKGRLAEFPRTLVDAFFALGVGFGTLAIPLTFDRHWTGTAWAVEGAGLVWLGVRQQQLRSRLAGICLQLGAGLQLLSATQIYETVPVLNTFCLGALMVSAAAFSSAFYMDRHRDAIEPGERDIPIGLLAWSFMWWIGAASREISIHVVDVDRTYAFLMFVTGTVAVLTLLRDWLKWRLLSYPVFLLFPVMALLAIDASIKDPHPLYGFGRFAWPAAIAVHYWMQRRLSTDWPQRIAVQLHQGMLLLVAFLASWELGWLARHISANTPMWQQVAWIVVPCGLMSAHFVVRKSRSHLSAAFVEAHSTTTAAFAAVVGVWLLATSATRGNPLPLAYMPLLNPLELVQCIVLALLLQWLRAPEIRVTRRRSAAVVSALGFVVLNGVIARATHFLTGIEFTFETLWLSPFYQAAVSIIWTLTALTLMMVARRHQQRSAWFSGALLLALVVTKLFAVDLDDIGTVTRIVSFVGVGLLMLLMGYLSPLPPRFEESRG